MRLVTISDRLTKTGGFGPGFDTTRVVLAIAVMVWHSFAVVDGDVETPKASIFWALWYANLPMFFALSGFLVMRSATKLTMTDYFVNRIVRIIPALVIVVLCSTFIVGPAVTTLPVYEYLTHPDTWRYLLGAIGIVSFHLPGVFQDMPFPAVNGSLWTIPYELAYYIIIAVLMITGLVRRASSLAAIIVLYCVSAVFVQEFELRTGLSVIDKLIAFAFLSKGASLIPAFMAGSWLYLCRERIPFHGSIAASCLAFFLLAGYFGSPEWFSSNMWVALSCLPLTYLIVWLGLSDLPKLPIFSRGDFSYGIYLWHFPILMLTQLTVAQDSWWKLSVLAFPAVLSVAMASWFLVERPALLARRASSMPLRPQEAKLLSPSPNN